VHRERLFRLGYRDTPAHDHRCELFLAALEGVILILPDLDNIFCHILYKPAATYLPRTATRLKLASAAW